MRTFKRICIKDFVANGHFTIKRGEEYLTSPVRLEIGHEFVTVYSSFWVYNVPANIFAGEQVFTEENKMGHYYSEMNFKAPRHELPKCDQCCAEVPMVIKINQGLRHSELTTSKIEHMWCWDCITQEAKKRVHDAG